MKNMKIAVKHTKFLLVFVILNLIACSPEDREMGLQGEQGTQGIQGPQGEQGETGPPGATGSANVIFSEWVTVPSVAWTPTDGVSSVQRTAIITAPDITLEYIDTGLILAYGRLSLFGNNNAIPFPISNGPFQFSVGLITPGEIEIWLRRFDGANFTVAPGDIQFRYVIIPGGVPISGKAHRTDFSKMTYREVMD
ncbi:MAG: hypothetical protein ACFB0A_10845 [Croceivirga sp.]